MIRKGDIVKVITGKDKGKTAKVLKIDNKKNRLLLEKTNLVKRHQKPNQQYRQGGIVEKEAYINVSNVMFYDEKTHKPSRIGMKMMGKKKVRYSKRSGEVLETK